MRWNIHSVITGAFYEAHLSPLSRVMILSLSFHEYLVSCSVILDDESALLFITRALGHDFYTCGIIGVSDLIRRYRARNWIIH